MAEQRINNEPQPETDLYVIQISHPLYGVCYLEGYRDNPELTKDIKEAERQDEESGKYLISILDPEWKPYLQWIEQ